jgi:hypothetical protein
MVMLLIPMSVAKISYTLQKLVIMSCPSLSVTYIEPDGYTATRLHREWQRQDHTLEDTAVVLVSV